MKVRFASVCCCCRCCCRRAAAGWLAPVGLAELAPLGSPPADRVAASERQRERERDAALKRLLELTRERERASRASGLAQRSRKRLHCSLSRVPFPLCSSPTFAFSSLRSLACQIIASDSLSAGAAPRCAQNLGGAADSRRATTSSQQPMRLAALNEPASGGRYLCVDSESTSRRRLGQSKQASKRAGKRTSGLLACR